MLREGEKEESRVDCKSDEIFENKRNIQGRRMYVYDANDKAEHNYRGDSGQ